MLWNCAGLLVALIAVIAALCFWFNSHQFENLARERVISQLQKATGGRVEIRSFHWRLSNLEAQADGLVIHGLEDPGEAPYAQLESLRVRISILGFFSPRILLRELELVKPQVHLVVYPDGSTNQPHPPKTPKTGRPAIETVFDLQAGHVSVEQGSFNFYSRASGFDVMARYLPLEFQANDVSVQMQYVPAQGRDPESYHLETGVRDLDLLRGGQAPSASAFPAALQATLDLTRSAAYLRSLRVTEHTRGEKEHVLNVSGALFDFAHPHWEGNAGGEFDLHLLNPILGYPFTPEGVARMKLSASGNAQNFRIDGPVHVDRGAYVDPAVRAHNLQVDTRLHMDPDVMRFGSLVVRFAQGGQLQGDLELDHWAPHPPLKPATISAVPAETRPFVAGPPKHFWNRKHPPPPPAPVKSRDVLRKEPVTEITVHGKIAVTFVNVAIDTILDIVGQGPFTRLGVGTGVNGTATAEWINGDVNTLKVDAALGLAPNGQAPPDEVPASGVIEASYAQRNGAVDLRRLELKLPESSIKAHGRLGAFPLTSPTDLNIDFHSDDLGEFDSTLHDLGLQRNGKAGTAALPLALNGEADFHGTWQGSLISPRLDGNLSATQIVMELPPNPKEAPQARQFVRWDSVEARGSYDAERITILNGKFVRGDEQISFDGTLFADGTRAPGPVRGNELPAFHSDSLLRAHLRASKVDVNDVLPLLGVREPVSGTLQVDFEADGPLRSPGGSGWVELSDGMIYGEPVSRLRAQGTVVNEVVKLSTITIAAKAGNVSGSGSYDVRSRSFQAEARSAGLDIAAIEHLHKAGETVAGKLSFTAAGSGTVDQPKLEAQATLEGLSVDHEPLGSIEITAHTQNRNLVYDATSRMEAAQLVLHGQTDLRSDFQTQAKVDFSRFDIGAVFRLAHFDAIKGESALSGTATIEGPLAHVDALQGEVRLQTMAATVVGVHLQSEGGVHASIANARVTLDPVHITGEDTDLRASGTLDLREQRRLDFAASGSVNLKVVEMIDSRLTAGGTTTFQVEAHGPLADPHLQGKIDFDNGSLSLEDIPNGLSQLHGTLEFNQNRLEVRNLTAMTGGGQLILGGYLAYQQGLFADLSVTGKSIRIRYPQGVSSLADTTLHLQGSKSSLLLSGNVMLTRFSVSPDLDIAALASQATGVQPVMPPDAPSNHIRLDVRIRSSPQLNFQNAYAKLAGDVDLRVRGTVASPSLLGRVSITEGSATIAGTRYDLQQGDITFTNPVRIQPSIDLNATARVQDYDITLGLHGTPDKLSVTYRSDPPLPQSDVIALLALGRTQSEQGLYTQQQEQSAGLSPSTDLLLGGALNATVSSRVQKLFGAGSVKVDPSYLGALGVSTTRITVDEQLGKNLKLTYATNVDTSAQQLLQAEIAINRHLSLLMTRDESDVFSVVVKNTRRYR
ncbi:MAG TPA: translocation/assembly module TamB domain-containing protein [Terracidiphilus sp.]